MPAEAGTGADAGTAIAEATMAAGLLPEKMGITITSAAAGRVEATMPVAGNIQPYGLLHGGASCVLAETIGSVGAMLHAQRTGPDRIAVGTEINASHHRAARSGRLTGVATLLYGGRTIASYEIVITDEAGRRICTARLTCAILDRTRGAGPAPVNPR